MVLWALSGAAAAPGAEVLKSLNVGIFHGQSARASVRFLMDYYRDEAPYRVRPEIDNAGRFLSVTDAAVARSFASAKNLESVEEASRAGVDLVAVIEAQAGFKRDITLEKSARVVLKAEFRDLAGQRILSLEAESVQTPVVDARVRVRRDLYREFSAALDAAAADLQVQIRASPELALFAAVAATRGSAPKSGAGQALNSDVDNASYRLPVEPTAVAWVAGIERYQDGSSAPHAERDAVAVRNQLIGLGWPDRNVLWSAGRRADRAQLLQGLENLKHRGAGAAKVFVYFAGRTAQDPKTGRTMLVAWDGGTVPLEDVLEAEAGLGAGAAVAVVEAPASLGQPRPGLVAMAAAASDQRREVSASEGHGIFTLELLRAFNGAADKQGKVTARAAFERAAAGVGETSAGRQVPGCSAVTGVDAVIVEGSRSNR
jgi:hypothetical protein